MELLHVQRGKYAIAEVQVAKLADFGTNDTTYYTRTHLGYLIKPGDIVVGYALATANANDSHFDKMNRNMIPDVVFVKKSYSQRKKSKRRR